MSALSGITIPENSRAYYRKARFLMYLAVFLIVGNFLMGVLFPTFVFPFDFRTPGSLRNTLSDPRTPEGQTLESGRLEPENVLVANASVFGRFEQAEVKTTLEKDSRAAETLSVSFRRSYRSFLSSKGEPITDFPEGRRYRVADTYYELRGSTLHPFVSEAAFQSRYPLAFAEPADISLLEQFTVSEQWLGYRPGTLLAFAEGVFVVISEEEVRPIGSADIFLRLGYHFEDVVPASAEEVGIYTRGRIILLGAPHPTGTIFQDTDSGAYYLVENQSLRPLPPSQYHDFLLSQNGVILASSKDAEKVTRCDLAPALSARTWKCEAPVDGLSDNLGHDYEIRLSHTGEAIELERLTVSLESEKSLMSARRLLNQIKVRFLIRFGYENAP